MMIRNLAKRVLQTRVASKSLSFEFSRESQKKFNENGLNLEDEMKTNEAISKNVGINKFLGRVYNTTGLSILSALSTSYAVMSVPALSAMMAPLALGGMLASLVGLIGSSYMKPTYYTSLQKVDHQNVEILKSKNSMMRQALYGTGVIGLGLSATPLFAMAAAISPTILPTAIGLTTAIFGGASLMAYNMPKDKMLSYGKPLMGALIGLIGLQLAGLLGAVFMGPNPISMMLYSATSYISIGLFSIMIAYDTHVSIKMYEMGQPDHLGMAVQFLLDFWNILTSLVRILSNSSD